MPTPLFSLVVPAFNAAPHLAACARAAFDGGVADIELLVVDDGSRDETASVLDRLSRDDDRVRVVRHDGGANRGVAASRNLGLAAARGDWVWFVDADDRLVPGALSQIAAIAERHRPDVITFNAIETGGDLPDAPLYRLPKPATPLRGEAWVALWCRQNECRQYTWLRACRREFLLRHDIRFPEGLLHEDIPWATEVDLAADSIVYVDAVLYHWMRTPNSLTRTPTDEALFARASGMIEIVARLRAIHARYPMSASTHRLLQVELVGQGMQLVRLRESIRSASLRAELDRRLRDARFWPQLWGDAVSWRRKRHVASQWLRQWLRAA